VETTRHKIRLYRKQAEFRAGRALYRAFVGGISTGKSWIGSYDLIRRSRPGRTYMIVGPSYTNLQRSSLRSFLALARSLDLIEPDTLRLSAPPQLTLRNGAEVLFASADRPESLRGPNLSGVWLDEASLMPEDAYDISIGRLRECGEQGWLSATFTPKGPSHWTKRVFDSGRPDTSLTRARTADNPFNPAGFADTLRKQYTPEFARQELDGEFVALEGAAFPPEWFDWSGFWFDDWPAVWDCKALYLDPAKGEARDKKHGDYQAFAFGMLAVHEGKNTLFLDADLLRTDVTALVRRGADHCRAFRPDLWEIEDNGTMGFLEPLVESTLQASNVVVPWLPVTHTEPKHVRVMRLAGYLHQRMIRIRDTPGGRLLRAQLGDFPLGDYDDGPDAAAGVVRRLELLSGVP